MGATTMQKRKILLIAVNVSDQWNPIDTFRAIRERLPLARMTAFGVPTRMSREAVKEWSKEPRATLGLYGWRGVSLEMHDWTSGEAYLKLRDSFDRGPFAPLVFAPDQALSNELVAVLSDGDGDKLPQVGVCGPYHVVDNFDPRTKVLPFAGSSNIEGTLALFVKPDLNVSEFLEIVEAGAAEMHFIDPIANMRNAKGLAPTQLEERTIA